MTLPYKGAQARIAKQKVLILKELEKAGIALQAYKKVGISKTSYYRWKKEDPKFAEKVREATEMGTNYFNDVAESQLLRLVTVGELQATKFWLKHRHPAFNAAYRLYEQRQHQCPSSNVEDIVLSDEEKAEMLEVMGGVKEYQRFRAAEASNPELFRRLVAPDEDTSADNQDL